MNMLNTPFSAADGCTALPFASTSTTTRVRYLWTTMLDLRDIHRPSVDQDAADYRLSRRMVGEMRVALLDARELRVPLTDDYYAVRDAVACIVPPERTPAQFVVLENKAASAMGSLAEARKQLEEIALLRAEVEGLKLLLIAGRFNN